MKVEVKVLEDLMREISVEIPAETVADEIEKKFADLRRDTTVKGFRKGKAPMARIKAEFGDEVKADIATELVKATYPDATRQENLRVASFGNVTDADYSDDGGFQYTARIEVMPDIESVSYDGLEVKVEEVEVSDQEVDEFVEVLRKRFSVPRPVDREARDGDIVVANLKKLHDPGLVLKEDSFQDQQIDLGNPQTVREFREQLPGVKAGDDKEVEVNYPDDYPDPTYAGAQLKYRVSATEIREQVLPEFNDAFARQTGQAETALELRLKIREEIKERVKAGQEKDKRGQIIVQICNQNEISVPESFLDNYLANVTDEFKKRYNDVDEADIRKNYRDVGIRTIRWNMLYHKLSEQEEVEVLLSDTEKRISMFAENYQMSFEQAREALAKSGAVADIKDSILEEKVLDFLVTGAKVVTTKKQN
ncbi:MAG: trigger factor [candidate division Zixibacteria bacterium]|nr:trigger factor [candidate division Zixibacteria bacterium]